MDRTCWLCGALITPDSDKSQAIDAVQTAPERFSFSLTTLLLLVTLAAVCFGLLTVAPGLGIPMCVLLVPVLVRTVMVVRRREAAGLPVSGIQKISLVVTSFGVATVVTVVVAVAAFCSFCGVCLLAMSSGDEEVPMYGMGIVAVVAMGLLVALSRWIRRRYRRDVGKE